MTGDPERPGDWLEDRTGARSGVRRFLDEPVPPNVGWSHVLGSAILFCLVVQLVTGVAMMLYYAPTPDHALESIRYLESQRFGALVRGLHVWGASFAVVLCVLHAARVFISGAHRPPRELNWIVGVVLLGLVLGFSFTGYLLPWDQKAYWATVVGTEVMGTAPLIGEPLMRFVRGGDDVGALTLSRFFTLHVVLLPAVLVFLVGFHIYLLRRHGSKPGDDWQPDRDATRPFAPAQLLRDTIAASLVFVLLVTCARLLPPHLDAVANPGDTGYVPRPEWYFLFLFQLLRYFEGPLEIVGTIVLPGLAFAALVALPFVDRNSTRRGRAALTGAALIIVSMLTLIGARDRRQATGDGGERASALALAGRSLAIEVGCAACHTWSAAGGEAELAGVPGTRDADWRWQHYIDPLATTGRDDVDARALIDEEAAAIAAFVEDIADEAAPVLTAGDSELAGGRALFDWLCIDCHSIAGAGGNQGPELDGAGARHDRVWLEEQILHPKRHKPDGEMPALAGKIDDKSLGTIVDYLATLR